MVSVLANDYLSNNKLKTVKNFERIAFKKVIKIK